MRHTPSFEMSKKSPKIQKLIAHCHQKDLNPHYIGYFECFNRQDYYDAHDVLEELWLKDGKNGENYAFYKGLIQAAGAFVHLKKNYQFPHHRIHKNRLNPSARLFRLALANVKEYPLSSNCYQNLNIPDFCQLCQRYLKALEEKNYQDNPWSPETAPQLHLTS